LAGNAIGGAGTYQLILNHILRWEDGGALVEAEVVLHSVEVRDGETAPEAEEGDLLTFLFMPYGESANVLPQLQQLAPKCVLVDAATADSMPPLGTATESVLGQDVETADDEAEGAREVAAFDALMLNVGDL
jgi:hypothetical protein